MSRWNDQGVKQVEGEDEREKVYRRKFKFSVLDAIIVIQSN